MNQLKDHVLQLMCEPLLTLNAYLLLINAVKALLSKLWMERNHHTFQGSSHSRYDYFESAYLKTWS